MCIAGNQARLMTLCSRQHDLELRAQNISAIKMVKAMESQEMATKYSDALDTYSKMKSGELQSHDYAFMITAKDSYGRSGLTGDVFLSTDGYTEAQIRNEYGDSFVKQDMGTESKYTKEQCEEFLKKAEAEYDIETKKLSSEEKKLDLELTQINTEHSAVTTEYDSVKSLISDNTDKSFNIFG